MKLDDMVKEFRSAATFGLLLCSLWLASSPGYVESLRHKAELRQLMAFLILKDDMPDILRDDIMPLEISRACPSVSKPECKAQKIVFDPPWKELSGNSIRLDVIPIRQAGKNGYNTFEIEQNNSEEQLPFEYYCLDIDRDSVFHPNTDRPTHSLDTPPNGSSCNFDNQVGQPYLWERMRGWLFSSGVVTPDPRNIKLSDPAISKLAIQYFSQDSDLHQDIAGLPIPIFLVPFVVGTLLTIVSSILVGTAVAFFDLRVQTHPDSTCWVMLYTGRGRVFTLIASITLALGTLVVPFAAIIRTLHILNSPEGSEAGKIALYTLLGGLILLLATVICNLAAQAALRQVLVAEQRHDV
jgi:hypothetical protein